MSRHALVWVARLWSSPARLILCLAWTVSAAPSCAHDSTAPSLPVVPPLEPVAFDAIGSGKVMFHRIGGGGSFVAVYVIDADARNTSTALDTVTSFVFGPSISPAGDRVAWLRWTDTYSCYDVYTTDLSGGSPKRVSSFDCNSEDTPSWTPDGSGVVFVVEEGMRSTDAWGVFEYVAATGLVVALRTFSVDSSGNGGCPAAIRWMEDGPVSVSAREGVAYACGPEIVVAESASDSLRIRYSVADPSLADLYSPAWSPDGNKLAFLEVLHGAEWSIVSTSPKLLDLGSGTVRTLATVPGSGRSWWWDANLISLCWLSGGDKLVFNAPSSGVTGDDPMRASLYVVGADGSGLVRLTTAADAFDHSLSCSR